MQELFLYWTTTVGWAGVDSQLDRITVHIVVVQRSGLNQTIPRSDNIMGSGDGFAQLALMWGKLSFWLVLARCFPALWFHGLYKVGSPLAIVFLTSEHKAVHKVAFCQFLFQWIYYCYISKPTRKETGKMHLCAALGRRTKFWHLNIKFGLCYLNSLAFGI